MKLNAKKIIAGASALAVLACTSFTNFGNVSETAPLTASAETKYNYGEALQKSMFFYEVQQCGEIPDWNKAQWRDDCMVNDYIPGGWFDAGDHLKFTLTNAYSAAILGWGYLQYKDGLEKCGETDEYLLNLKWALDYIAACDLGEEVVYMIGDGAFDHVWWGSAEVYMEKFELQTGETVRPYYTTVNSAVTAQMAAALAVGSMVFEESDPELAAYYLEHALNCYEIADTNRDLGGDEAQQSYYKCSTFYDDLFYAANWLYMATGEQSYLDECKTDFIPNLGTESQSTELKYTWGFCWDDAQQAGTLLYAINTGDTQWISQFKKHLEYWTTGYGGKQIQYTPDGLAWLFNWGSLRHATTTAFLSYVACDTILADDTAAVEKYTKFADSQMNYCFGDNDNDMSYVIGMGDSYPQAWHHRTSSGAWNDKWTNIGQTEGDDAKPHAHTLYGALVGGPDQNGTYSDKISDYQYTEVAIDYNAGYTAALCAMVSKYGGTSDPSFPETESPKWDEFYVEASINQASQNFTEIKVQATNHSAWPARTIKDLSYNYYMDLSELFEAGYSASDLKVNIGYDEFHNCTISEPIQYDGNIYYVKISYEDGTKIMPTGQSEHQGEIQFRVSAPDATSFWNADNDYSFNGLLSGSDTTVTKYITMYDGDTLIWGIEPDGTEPSAPAVTTPAETTTSASETTPAETTSEGDVSSATETTSVSITTDNSDTSDSNSGGSPEKTLGDVNCDGKISAVDIVVLKQHLLELKSITGQGLLNADMNDDGKVTVLDFIPLKNLVLN